MGSRWKGGLGHLAVNPPNKFLFRERGAEKGGREKEKIKLWALG